jgi:hypothetical protein
MAKYILTCFRSHDPTFQLTPVLVGPIRATAAAAQEGVQEAADMVASASGAVPDLQGGETPPDHQSNRSSIFFVVFVI